LSKPDADLMWRVRGKLSLIREGSKSDDSLPFNGNSAWATLYAGSTKNRHTLTYEQFSQLLREKVRQFDPKGTGFIEVADFMRIVQETAGHH
jgi:solute carrier family 25 aspartate/glutamate transporter 12/13